MLMTQSERGQVTASAADIYEEFFVPALFQEWTGRVVDAARVQTGHSVLDVACGTGILARAAAERSGPTGSVTGLDVNEGMLAVAAKKAPGIQWQLGPAEEMPFEDCTFDAVVCQFGLMFFEDRRKAISEMVRVLKPGGRLAIAVWDSLDHTPFYSLMVQLLQRLFGDQPADGLRGPFVLGDPGELRSLFDQAQIRPPELVTVEGTGRFPSIESWVYTEIKGWVLADLLSDAQIEHLLGEARKAFSQFQTPEGGVVFSSSAHIFSASRA
jgi:SAM-dependent methyltransferase